MKRKINHKRSSDEEVATIAMLVGFGRLVDSKPEDSFVIYRKEQVVARWSDGEASRGTH